MRSSGVWTVPKLISRPALYWFVTCCPRMSNCATAVSFRHLAKMTSLVFLRMEEQSNLPCSSSRRAERTCLHTINATRVLFYSIAFLVLVYHKHYVSFRMPTHSQSIQ